MDYLFDSFEGYTPITGNGLSSSEPGTAKPRAAEEQDIIDELCRLTDDDSTQLRKEIDSLDDNCAIESQINERIPSPPRITEIGFKLKDPPDKNEILSADPSTITANAHNVGVINAACQEVLKEMETQLLCLLKINRQEQDVVMNFLNNTQKKGISLWNFDANKKLNLKCVGMPYFKDSEGYMSPLNEDVWRKKRNKKLLPADFIDNSPVWLSSDSKNLIKAVNKVAGDSSDWESVDWMMISVTHMDGKYSPSECKSKWMLNLNPKVNRSKWGMKEMKSLQVIAEKYNQQDWDKIAAELGTNRTGFQCCVQYQAHTSTNTGKWSKKEDDTLKKLVEKYKTKDYIPWMKVTWHFERRSLRQCQERFAYHLGNIKKGNFTTEEDFVLVYLASKLKNFGEVAKYLPKRVSTQVRARYEYLVNLSMPDFTKEEDELLIQLMAKYPRNWAKISEHFKNRSKLQLRRRWAVIQKEIKLDKDLSDNELDVSDSLDLSKEKISQGPQKNQLDTVCVVKKLSMSSKSDTSLTKGYPEMYYKLLEYHKYCYKFLFGPKQRIPTDSEFVNLVKKMQVTMGNLSVNVKGALNTYDINTLSKNSEFGSEDISVLSKLKESDTNRNVVVSNRVIPANYINLVGLRTLTLGWSKIQNLCDDYKESPRFRNNSENIDRVLCSDAKKLFKDRLKALFVFPIIFSEITPDCIETKPVYKGKVRKPPKPLSKRKRKKIAKMISQAYRNKLQKQLNKKLIQSGNELDVEVTNEGDENTGNNEGNVENGPDAANTVKRKRGRPRKSQPMEDGDDISAPKKPQLINS